MPNHLFDVIATIGDTIPFGASLTGFENTTSINDLSLVAFIGKVGTIEDLLVSNGDNSITNLSSGHSGGGFRSGVEINNDNKVVAVDHSSGLSAIRLWDANLPGSFLKNIGTGQFPPTTFIDFENIFPFPRLNNNSSEDQVVFLATPKNQFPNIGLETFAGQGVFNRQYNTRILTNFTSLPAIADNGTVVAKDLGEQIFLYDYQLNAIDVISSTLLGFDSVGTRPGISNDGKVVAFYGDLVDPEASFLTQGLEAGKGVFISIETNLGRIIQRIAGIAGNGKLDPGEKYNDDNIDEGLISDFNLNESIGVNFTETDNQGIGTITYLALDKNGNESLISSKFTLEKPVLLEPIFNVLSQDQIVTVEQEASSISSELTGKIEDINIYDPINTLSQIAFWAKTDNGNEAIVRANPIRKPILIVPGIGGSLPDTKKDFRNWITELGFDPSKLKSDPFVNTYSDLVETLKNAGYEEGVNLFVATHDWRLNPGPIDGTIDGVIERSIDELTDDIYEYSVDQLAFWMEEAETQWKKQFEDQGLPLEELESVDVIAHSAGGAVVRSYIQSTAYSQEDFDLPKVNNFITLGVPFRGSPSPMRPLNNDFGADITFALLGDITKSAYNKVIKKDDETITVTGEVIGNDGKQLEGVIDKDRIINELSDPKDFIKAYIPNLQALLATYPFIGADEPRKKAEENFENKLLLDLNDGIASKEDVIEGKNPNRFADLIEGQVKIFYGTERNSNSHVIEHIEPIESDNEEDEFLRTVRRFEDGFKTAPEFDELWYEIVKVENSGDGSLIDETAIQQFQQPEYKKENKIQLIPFDGTPHRNLAFDVKVQQSILENLGISLEPEFISTGLSTSLPALNLDFIVGDSSALVANFGIYSSYINDPAEGFLIDGQGRRLGYTTATGAVTEIPNSVWLGEADGIGYITDTVEGPFQLELTGLGEDYFISVALETEEGPAGIELEGFLAQGEQLTVDIPLIEIPDPSDPSCNPTTGDDDLTSCATSGDDTINGLGGNDTIVGLAGDDSLDGQADNDSLNGGDGNDSLFGSNGDDTLIGEQGNDSLLGGNHDDSLNGGNGQDTLNGGNGADILLGQSDDDTLNGGNGNDTLNGGAGADKLYGQNDDDTLNGGNGNDTLGGGFGADKIYGQNDDDRLVGNDGNDTLGGGSGADRLDGQNDDDRLSGSDGNDTLNGGPGADQLFGQNDDDTLNGGDGSDTLNGGLGADKLFGQNDDDTLNGGDGSDTLGGGLGADKLFGQNDDDRLWGGDGNDTLGGGAGADKLFGQNDDDRLWGGDGNDTLGGDAGADKLYGHDGDDRLVGGLGVDSLTGGAGNDRFVIVSGLTGDRDIIQDYQDGFDLLDLTGDLTFGNLTINQKFANTEIIETATNETLAILSGIDAVTIDSSDFV